MTQKKFSLWLMAACLVFGLGLTSCAGEEDDLVDPSTIDITKIHGYWEDDANTDCWLYTADHYGLYWDKEESSEEQAATGSGKFRWEYDGTTTLMRYHWMSSTNQYAAPDTFDPSKILTLTDRRMEYKTVDGEYHSFTKVTKP